MKKVIIGGEYTFHEEMLEEPFKQTVLDMALEHHPDFHHFLTGGGYFSLKVILQHLQEEGLTDSPVWLPAFLCPSVLKPFAELEVPYEFYPVDENLRIDTQSLLSAKSKGLLKVLMVIPYFGFDFHANDRKTLNDLRLSGVRIIEDRAQCLFPGFEPVGNVLFYSFRKFLPVDGSLLLSDTPLIYETTHENHHYTALKKYGQELRHRFLHEGADTEEEFLRVFSQAEKAYYTEGIAGFEMTNLALFPRLNVADEIIRRRDIFQLLDQQLGDVGLLHGHNTANASPLCYPIRVPERDMLLEKLKEHLIFAPVHWRINTREVPETFVSTHVLASSLISLPIRTDVADEAHISMAKVVRDHLHAHRLL